MQFLHPLCIICDGKSDRELSLCQSCLSDLPCNHNACPQCGLGLQTDETHLCGKCQSKPPKYHKTISPFLYQHAIQHLIIGLKFNGKLLNADILGRLLTAEIQQYNHALPDFLLPVPLHTTRIRKRGFNQSIEIAKVLSKRFDIPVLTQAISKQKATTPQANLTAKQRRKNLKHSFQIKNQIPKAHIAIIDDVITTGSTMNEIAQLLQKAGATQIQAWACARTP